MISKLKVGLKAQVITGIYKGLVGTILFISKKKSLVSLDIIPKRIKFTKEKSSSKRIELLSFVHVSNIKLYRNKLD